jgi:tRNA (cytidine/uridine-2'-O-)-methyltransferase
MYLYLIIHAYRPLRARDTANTGNIARLSAASRTDLHIVGPTGFRMDDRTLKRAGLDYWDEVKLHRHIDLDALYASLPDSRFLYLTTKAT